MSSHPSFCHLDCSNIELLLLHLNAPSLYFYTSGSEVDWIWTRMDVEDLDYHSASTERSFLDSPSSSSSSPPPTQLGSPTGSSSSAGSGVSTPSVASSCFSESQHFSCQVEALFRGHFPQRLCLVCGDVASGFHYGVASCEACKAFFKRTVQGNMEYSCPVSKECEINKRRRKACQACRFHKCLQAGMMKEGVRMDRVRGGRQKYKRRAEAGITSYSRTAHGACSSSSQPAPLAANQDESTNDGTLLTLCDLLNRQLLVLIGWAKQIPGFSALSLVDQMSLLQSGWMEALLVGVAWRSQGAAGKELVFAKNLRLDQSQCRLAGLSELYDAVRHLTSRYCLMELSLEEVVTLKAMALANADVDPVDCPDSLQRFQDGLHEALQEYEASCGGRHRAGRLLMSLPLLRETAERAVEVLLRTRRRVPLHRLLLEMLDANLAKV
ncbi:estrogen-related receptor gamma-like isoform X2 [Nerophis lumbriciformis]|uniref:estrogen-related receptor gamma-like isoform X2 n=1 Tax=Nerophis lumbriciformis TaxID=546530 RepID=UPI002AE09A96|nr:estrogen-related receptor gamma-like isoform X2 [Nerophis lumbriciformis]